MIINRIATRNAKVISSAFQSKVAKYSAGKASSILSSPSSVLDDIEIDTSHDLMIHHTTGNNDKRLDKCQKTIVRIDIWAWNSFVSFWFVLTFLFVLTFIAALLHWFFTFYTHSIFFQINHLTQQQTKTIEKTVPWFMNNMLVSIHIYITLIVIQYALYYPSVMCTSSS